MAARQRSVVWTRASLMSGSDVWRFFRELLTPIRHGRILVDNPTNYRWMAPAVSRRHSIMQRTMSNDPRPHVRGRPDDDRRAWQPGRRSARAARTAAWRPGRCGSDILATLIRRAVDGTPSNVLIEKRFALVLLAAIGDVGRVSALGPETRALRAPLAELVGI